MEKELLLIWKDKKERRRFIIGHLSFNNDEYTFKYVDPEISDAKKYGFDYFPGFENLNVEYKSKTLFANIATRLPNKLRPDYLNIMNSYNLDMTSSEMDILTVTKGRLITDDYEFVTPFNKNKIEFDLAGTNYCQDIDKCKEDLKTGNNLFLELESNNPKDKYAIKVIYRNNNCKYHLGYVPRYYSKELTELLKSNVNYSAQIKKINFETRLNDEDITAYVKFIFDNN